MTEFHMSTPFHARYFAHELTRQRPAADDDRLSMSLFDASVDLNPHQIEAAMFALKSPLSKGVILADEVGLGKTIEAGLILCQYWAERRRRLLVVCPASLRKQWSLELEEKFNLPTLILDAPTLKQLKQDGIEPFLADAILIVSLNFASTAQNEVGAVTWDLVVIDEAHKLRNAYRTSNKMGQRLREALAERRKILLTATPLQNSLLELFGLCSVIDERIFGEVSAFRSQYMNQDADLKELRARLQYFCKRTLRNQVVEYIQYTERRAITVPFSPVDEEHRLYDALSQFLLREDTYSIPSRQRVMTTLILRKLLASSSRAIAGTLETMRSRLIKLREGLPPTEGLAEQLIFSEELEDEYLDEAPAEGNETPQGAAEPPKEPAIDRKKLDDEIEELERYILWARSVGVDTKSKALLTALETGFSNMTEMGANRKALVFTESRRTQQYLKSFLEANGYAGQIVLFSGSNTDPESQTIYERWKVENVATGRATGSKAIDLRTALIEHFRDRGTIMIATEAGAEGINLQFCSLVINYDLPWNPQRIEQRIGRCHRYGQKHDVVVVNFLNERNAADRRVMELLAEKFNLFSGVFGASDEVLGTIESGVDFEKRILAIYQQCRTPEEIDTAFFKLREEMDASIKDRIEATRRTLLEHFDEDVHVRLRVRLDTTREELDRVGQLFWDVTRFMLRDHASFDDRELTFDLQTPPTPHIHRGLYHLISKTQPNVPGEFLYRLSHPLGQHVIDGAKRVPTPTSSVTFDVTGRGTHIAAVEALKGVSGWLVLQHLAVDSFEREEYLLFSGFCDDGRSLDQETCERLFRCTGAVKELIAPSSDKETHLIQEAQRHVEATMARSLETNNRYFSQEREKLERWADDMVLGAEKDLAATKAQIKALSRQARLATSLEDQHTVQEKIRELERLQRKQRQHIFDVEDEIVGKRDQLIAALEKRLSQRSSIERLFTMRWTVE